MTKREQLIRKIEVAHKLGFYDVTRVNLIKFKQLYDHREKMGTSWLLTLLIKDIENKLEKGFDVSN